MLGRSSHLERVSRWLARREQELQVRLARELVARCRSLTRAIAELDQRARTADRSDAPALLELPGCAAVTAAKLLAEIGPIDRFKSDAQLARHGGVAPLEASSGRSPTAPARPRRQPPTQRRALPNRDHTSPLPPRRARLPRTQTGRRQEPPRGDPLPQTTPRPRRLQHPESEPRLDIGATLGHQATCIMQPVA